ncbi:MAG: hypothetical protein IKD18_02565 [Clostridia bacterium]|nr:hypothetical protein [Clostridia bacterium]
MDLMKKKEKTVSTSSDKNLEKKAKPSLFAILFSVLVALVLWFYVQDAETPDYKKTFTSVSVEMQSLSTTLSVIEGAENTVDITLIGKRSDLNKIKTSDLVAYLDLSSVLQPGHYESDISVMLPEGAELFDCFPKKAAYFVDQTVSVSVPVAVELGSYTAPESIGIEAAPAVKEISLKGPESVLKTVRQAKIVTGELGEINSSFERNMEYDLYDENGAIVESRHILLPEKNLKVAFTVYKTKSVPLTVQSLHGWWKAEDMRVSVTPETVIIKGEPALVDAVESVPAVIIDETTLDSNRYTATLAPSQLVFPAGIALGETIGDVGVNLTLNDNGARNLKMNLNSNHVAVTAPSAELNYAFQTTALNFRIRGSFDTIYDADVNDFYLNIDLSEITAPGEVEVPVQIVQTSASEGKYYPVGNYTVKVTIS